MKKLSIIALAVMACSPALAATMASQPWVTNRIAEAEARTDAKITAATNAIPAPGDYATVSNRAMSALQSHQPLTPATNYTDAVAAEFESGARTAANANGALQANYAESAGEATSATWAARLSDGGSVGADNLTYSDIIGGFVAATNGVPEAIGRKQDRLPYPTNAIPYAAISGGPVWRVTEVDENTPVSFVTNGIAAKLINGELYADAAGWPDGAAMFVRGSVVPGPYDVGEDIRLVGYGTWPTNSFQSVWWRSGATIYVNILVED